MKGTLSKQFESLAQALDFALISQFLVLHDKRSQGTAARPGQTANMIAPSISRVAQGRRAYKGKADPAIRPTMPLDDRNSAQWTPPHVPGYPECV